MACVLFGSSAVRVHDSQAYRQMNVTRECNRHILELTEILLSFQTGLNLVNASVVCAIKNSSGLEPSLSQVQYQNEKSILLGQTGNSDTMLYMSFTLLSLSLSLSLSLHLSLNLSLSPLSSLSLPLSSPLSLLPLSLSLPLPLSNPLFPISLLHLSFSPSVPPPPLSL